MEQKNSILTIILVLLIALAIFAIVFFNREKIINLPNIYEERSYVDTPLPKETTKDKVPECIASFTTNITYPDGNRNHNIITCCNYLNGKIIKSGQIFSFNNTLGPFTYDKGYVDSTGFDSQGRLIKIIAGGICQVSSTIYNSALMSEFKIIERNEHSAPVNYVPYGKDAAVCYPDVDLRFKNTKHFDVKVKAFCDGKKVTIELYKN